MLAIAARREGLSFDEFWERALRLNRDPQLTWRTVDREPPWGHTEWPPPGAVRWPNDTHDRQIAMQVHQDQVVKAAWRAAYYRQDSDAWR